MESLYRVVNKTDYEKALETGFVPRCNSDERANLVHLNIKQSVEIVASTYFDVSEFPVVLEVNPSSFPQAISWHEPTKAKPWKEARAAIQNIAMQSVCAVYELAYIEHGKDVKFKLGKRI